MVHDPLAGFRVLGFDLETTGLSSGRHRIIQYALVGCSEDGDSIHVEEMVDPQRRIPPDSTRVHGFNDSDVAGKLTFGEHVDRIDELIEGAVIVGHNVNRFDWPFMRDEYMRVGRMMPTPRAVIDTLVVARRLRLPRRHTLTAMCARYGVELERAHTAGADAAATLLLLWRIIEEHPRQFRRPLEDIEEWLASGRIGEDSDLGPGYDDLEPFDANGRLRWSDQELVLAFGRHRGVTLRTLELNDPSYLRWMLSGNGPLEQQDIQRLEHILESH